MNGGVGDTSYSNNSLLQKKALMKAKPLFEEIMKKMYCTIQPVSCLKMADLGCSSGPNTFLVVSEIIDIVEAARRSLKLHVTRSFQFFLNDLFGNNFNTILRSLADLDKRLEEEKGVKPFGTSCFANRTPGSFYGRLFPTNSINVYHSSYSLHWLSQAPKGLRNGAEPLNKDNIYVTSTIPPGVHQAYLEQFQHDFTLFLKLCVKELVRGGAMLLTMIAREDCSEITISWALLRLFC